MATATLEKPADTQALPDLSSDYPLTQDQKNDFARDGHILLRGVASPEEVAAYRPVITAAVDRFKTEMRPMEERDTYGKAFLQIMNLWVQDEAVRRYSLARRFGKIAADLMGVDGVRMWHDQALYKEPHGGITPWHQDQFYWPLDTDKTVTMWMPLVDVPIERGALTFASGTHTKGYLGELEISDESDAFFDRFVAEQGFPISVAPMAAGDATFHTGWTLHHAPGNATDTMREVMTVIYFADGIRISEPDNQARVNDLASWLPGLKPGDLAASELNPVIYRA
jgi:hypothetical protein